MDEDLVSIVRQAISHYNIYCHCNVLEKHGYHVLRKKIYIATMREPFA